MTTVFVVPISGRGVSRAWIDSVWSTVLLADERVNWLLAEPHSSDMAGDVDVSALSAEVDSSRWPRRSVR